MQAKSNSIQNPPNQQPKPSTLNTPALRCACVRCGSIFHHAGWYPLSAFHCFNCGGTLAPAGEVRR